MRFVKDHFDEYRESTIGGKVSFSCSPFIDKHLREGHKESESEDIR